MNVARKLTIFLEENGMQKKFFAAKVGVSQNYLFQVLRGTHPVPVKCWLRTIELTRGAITITDLMREKFKSLKNLELIETGDPLVCKVKVKSKL